MIKLKYYRRPFIMAREKKPVHKVVMTDGKRSTFFSENIVVPIVRSFIGSVMSAGHSNYMNRRIDMIN